MVWLLTRSSATYPDVTLDVFLDEASGMEAYDTSTRQDGDDTEVTLWSVNAQTGEKKIVASKIEE